MATHSNFKNDLIASVAPLPSLLFYLYFLSQYHDEQHHPLYNWCYQHPFLFANLLFFLNVNLLFWLIGLLQSSHWMIDLYWTVIPVMLVHFYANHPLAQYNVWRSKVVILLTWIWSIRLTHNYFQRENWQWGHRQDWRFTDISHQYPKHWWWISFFVVYVSQQVFLMGICLPMYVVHSEDKPLNIWDFIAVFICLSAIIIAYYADTQLYSFVSRNQKLKELGEPMVPNLDEGLWRYSRHPNYFGEQLWWWGLVLFAWNLGQAWTFVVHSLIACALHMSLCLLRIRCLSKPTELKHTSFTRGQHLFGYHGSSHLQKEKIRQLESIRCPPLLNVHDEDY